MKKRLPRDKARNDKRKSRDQQLQFYQHSITQLDPEALKQALVAAAKNSDADFRKQLRVVFELLRKWYPPHILATLAGWGLVTGVSEKGVAQQSLIQGVQQHHLELLQALVLMLPLGEWGKRPAVPEEMQKVIDTVAKLTDAFLHRRLLALTETIDEQQRTVLTLQERMRGHTQIVRNWGYFTDVVRISTELYAPFDADLTAYHGFSATQFIEVALSLVRKVEERISDRFGVLKKIFRASSIPQLVRRYYSLYPGIKGDPEEFIRNIPKGTEMGAVRARLLSHADLQLVTTFLASIEDIAQRTGSTGEVVKKVLDVLSLPPEALQFSDPERLFMANPVWVAPGIALGTDYFIPAPQCIFSHIHTIMRLLLEAAGLKSQLEKRRGLYLESKLHDLVVKALPAAAIRGNIKWRAADAEYETDLLASLDRVILIAEAKSAALTAQGLRGAPDRVRRHVQDLVVAPSEQSARLESIIWKAKQGDSGSLAITAGLSIDAANVDTVIRLSVTLDDFSVLSSAEGDLKDAGWVSNDLELAPTMNIADFGCVVDILNEPAFFLHYLADRGGMQRRSDLLGDELDLLGFYLETCFNVGKVVQEKPRLAVSGMSRTVDHFYTSRDAGIAVPKPKPKLHPYFSRVISVLQSRAAPAWSTFALAIIRSADLNEQRQIDRALEKLRKDVPKIYRDPKHICSVVMIPPAPSDMLVLFYVYPEALADRRHAAVQQLTSEVMEQHNRQRCVFVGRKIEDWDRPYQFMGLATLDRLPARHD